MIKAVLISSVFFLDHILWNGIIILGDYHSPLASDRESRQGCVTAKMWYPACLSASCSQIDAYCKMFRAPRRWPCKELSACYIVCRTEDGIWIVATLSRAERPGKENFTVKQEASFQFYFYFLNLYAKWLISWWFQLPHQWPLCSECVSSTGTCRKLSS